MAPPMMQASALEPPADRLPQNTPHKIFVQLRSLLWPNSRNRRNFFSLQVLHRSPEKLGGRDP